MPSPYAVQIGSAVQNRTVLYRKAPGAEITRCGSPLFHYREIRNWRLVDIQNSTTVKSNPPARSKTTSTTAITVLLTNEQAARLDEVSAAIRANVRLAD